jgi:hypothetical protein
VFFLYEKYLWRIINRKNYYGGYWKGTITYTECEKSIPLQEHLMLPYSFETVFQIVQKPFKFEIIPGKSPLLRETWTAKNIEIHNDAEFSFHYMVSRTTPSESPIPQKAEGFESVTTQNWDKYGRPCELEGQFYHLALPKTPLYRGESKYYKVQRKEWLEIKRRLENATYL